MLHSTRSSAGCDCRGNPCLPREIAIAVAVQYRLLEFLGTSRRKSLLNLANSKDDHSIWFLHVVLQVSSRCLLLTLERLVQFLRPSNEFLVSMRPYSGGLILARSTRYDVGTVRPFKTPIE
ncbi:hypothetical protein IG631_09097 [Alternaria alternata]|nr:hypothetical protein IG631_09097 [Alternaria alternata]